MSFRRAPWAPTQADVPHAADWLKDARLGIFMHFLPGNSNALANVNDFDVPALTGS